MIKIEVAVAAHEAARAVAHATLVEALAVAQADYANRTTRNFRVTFNAAYNAAHHAFGRSAHAASVTFCAARRAAA